MCFLVPGLVNDCMYVKKKIRFCLLHQIARSVFSTKLSSFFPPHSTHIARLRWLVLQKPGESALPQSSQRLNRSNLGKRTVLDLQSGLQKLHRERREGEE